MGDVEAEQVSEWLAWTGFAIYSVQAAVRCIGASKVRCTTLSHASVISVISLLYLLVLGVAAIEEKEWSWKAEPIAAMVLVAVTLMEGIRIVYNYLDDMDTRMHYDNRA